MNKIAIGLCSLLLALGLTVSNADAGPTRASGPVAVAPAPGSPTTAPAGKAKTHKKHSPAKGKKTGKKPAKKSKTSTKGKHSGKKTSKKGSKKSSKSGKKSGKKAKDPVTKKDLLKEAAKDLAKAAAHRADAAKVAKSNPAQAKKDLRDAKDEETWAKKDQAKAATMP